MRQDVPPDLANKQKLSDEQILDLAEVGNQIEMHYDRPMDIEWAMEEQHIFIVQARPVTTLSMDKEGKAAKEVEKLEDEKKILVKGLGASPGKAGGLVRIYAEGMSLDVVRRGDIMVTQMTTAGHGPGHDQGGGHRDR